MLEQFKEVIDRGNQFEALLTDLSKAFDCIDQEILIVKLYEYGVSSSSLNLILSYLKHRIVLGPLLFNINMVDLFYEYEENDIVNYVDNTTPYSCASDIPSVISEFLNLTKRI